MTKAKAASLGADPMSSVTGGRAVIDVGHPHVERHHAELEGDAGDHEDEAEDEHVRRLDRRDKPARCAMSRVPVAPYTIDMP